MVLFKESFISLIAGIFVMMAIYCNYSYSKLQQYQIEIINYQNTLTQFKNEAMEQQKRFAQAKKQAESQVVQMQENIKRILTSDVSKNCDKAMQWGIRQAHNFH
jgi:hypothetical protein